MYWNPCPYLQWPVAVVCVFSWSRETLADPSSSLYWRRHISAATSSNKHTKTLKHTQTTQRQLLEKCTGLTNRFSVRILPEVSVTVARWRHADVVLMRTITTQTSVTAGTIVMNGLNMTQKQSHEFRKHFTPSHRVCVTSHLQEKFVDHSL